LFLDQIHTILSTTVDDKGRWDSHWEVCHHVVGDYNFLTQKKKKIHPITPKLDVPLWFVMSSKSSKALVTMNSLNVCSCASIIHNTYTNVGWFSEVETDTHWLSTWLYLCLRISYQKNLKQALVYNHGFEKKFKKSKKLSKGVLCWFFHENWWFFESLEITMSDFLILSCLPKNRNWQFLQNWKNCPRRAHTAPLFMVTCAR
jgi:hypothetical protein